MHLQKIREVASTMRGWRWLRFSAISTQGIKVVFPVQRAQTCLSHKCLLKLGVIHDSFRLHLTVTGNVICATYSVYSILNGAVVCGLYYYQAREVQCLSVFLIAHVIRVHGAGAEPQALLLGYKLL